MFSIFNTKSESKEVKTASSVKPKKRYFEYASIDLEFVKAYSAQANWSKSSGDGWSRPDSIRFGFIDNFVIRQDLESEMTNHSIKFRRLPMNFYSAPGKFEIDVSHAERFLNILLSLKNKYDTEFIVSKTEYTQFLTDLVKSGYLTPERRDYFLKTMVTDLTLEERLKLAEEKHDFNEAIALAQLYKEDNDNGVLRINNKEMALYWLIQAVNYKKNGFEELQKIINLDEFLKSFKILYRPALLFNKRDNASFLLPILKNIVVELSFGYFCHPNAINSLLADFIANNNTLKKLNIGTKRSQDNDLTLNSSYMRYIAKGLQTNSSLESLDVSGQPIGDAGLFILLEALASNPKSNLKQLNLMNTEITVKGQQVLEEFLKTNKTLEWVNVNRNEGVNSETIYALTTKNQIAHAELEKESNLDDVSSSYSAPRGRAL